MSEKKRYLEAGKIVNTHGVRGGLKIQPWTDAPDFLCSVKVLYICGEKYKIESCSVQKTCVIAYLENVDNIDKAVAMKNKVVFIDRNDVSLPEGEYFLQDVIGLTVLDDETGAEIGTVRDVLEFPAGNVYVIDGGREILVPAVPEFIKKTDADGGTLRVRLIEGM